jgi:hypothetical protein
MRVTMEQVVDYLSRAEVKKHKATKKDVESILKDLAYLIALENETTKRSRIYMMLNREGKKLVNQN